MAACKDNLALFGIKTQSCWLCMSVILTLVSARLAHRRAGKRRSRTWQKDAGHGPSRSLLASLAHAITFLLPTLFHHPSSPLPAGALVEGAVGNAPVPSSTLLVRGSGGPRTASPAPQSHAAFTPSLPLTGGKHPETSPLVARSPFPAPATGEEKAASNTA